MKIFCEISPKMKFKARLFEFTLKYKVSVNLGDEAI